MFSTITMRRFAVIETNTVTVVYRTGPWSRDHLTAVDAVSLQVAEGARFAVVGESGCGKSSLLRAIAGLIPVAGGSISIDGVPIAGGGARGVLMYGARRVQRARRVHRARRVQMLGQHPEQLFDPRNTILDAVAEVVALHAEPGASYGVLRTKRCAELLGQVGLHQELWRRFPHELSGGQLQRAALARALAVQPQVLLLDEPTSMLDASVQARIMALIEEIRRSTGVTILLVSHDVSLVARVADVVAVMFRGRIVEQGAPPEVFSHPRHSHTRMLLEAHREMNVSADPV